MSWTICWGPLASQPVWCSLPVNSVNTWQCRAERAVHFSAAHIKRSSACSRTADPLKWGQGKLPWKQPPASNASNPLCPCNVRQNPSHLVGPKKDSTHPLKSAETPPRLKQKCRHEPNIQALSWPGPWCASGALSLVRLAAHGSIKAPPATTQTWAHGKYWYILLPS